MFWSVMVNENTKLIRRKLFRIEIFLIALIVLGILTALFITVETNRAGSGLLSDDRQMLLATLTWPEAWSNIIRLAGWDGIGPLFLMILIGAMTAQEYTWRTLHISLSRGISRKKLLMAKLTAFLFSALLIVSTILVIGGIATAIFSYVINGSLQISKLDIPQVISSILRATYTMLPYGCLVFFLAVLSRSTVTAISSGLIFSLVLENIIMSGAGLMGEWASQIVLYLPGGLSNSLLALNNAPLGTGSESVTSLVTPIPAAIGIAVWIMLFIGLSLWAFQRQDLAD